MACRPRALSTAPSHVACRPRALSTAPSHVACRPRALFRLSQGVEEVAVVGGDGFGVDPALEIELSEIAETQGVDVLAEAQARRAREAAADGAEANEQGNVVVREAIGVIKAFNPADLPPPAQLLNNAWPLAALWPLLYVFYQGELALGMNV